MTQKLMDQVTASAAMISRARPVAAAWSTSGDPMRGSQLRS